MKVAGKRSISRRSFLKTGLGTVAAIGFPTIVPASIFGQYAPSKRINVGAIGVGASHACTTCPASCSSIVRELLQFAILTRIA